MGTRRVFAKWKMAFNNAPPKFLYAFQVSICNKKGHFGGENFGRINTHTHAQIEGFFNQPRNVDECHMVNMCI